MSVAELREAVNGAIAESAQLQAFLRTIKGEIELIQARMATVGEGSSQQTLQAAYDALSIAATNTQYAIDQLETVKSEYYDYLAGV